MAALGAMLEATNPRPAVSLTSVSRRSGPPWPANRKSESRRRGRCQRRLTKTRRLCDGLMNPGEAQLFANPGDKSKFKSVALVERFRNSNHIDISLVQRSAPLRVTPKDGHQRGIWRAATFETRRPIARLLSRALRSPASAPWEPGRPSPQSRDSQRRPLPASRRRGGDR